MIVAICLLILRIQKKTQDTTTKYTDSSRPDRPDRDENDLIFIGKKCSARQHSGANVSKHPGLPGGNETSNSFELLY